jgi:hypothetical protein
LNIEATFWRVSSYYVPLLHPSLGFNILGLILGRDEGYWRLKIGSVLNSALASDPS